MEPKFLKPLHEDFAKLVERYGFAISKEQNDEQSYSIEYSSDTFSIKIEKYRRQFYVTLYKTSNSEKGVELFNLLDFLNKSSSTVPRSKYFEEENLDESYKKQLSHLSHVIYDNFDAIDSFFKDGIYETKIADIDKFMLNKYPWLFKKK